MERKLKEYHFACGLFPPHLAAKFLGVPENWVFAYLDAEARALDETKKNYMKNELPRVREQVKEMIAEMPEAERKEMRQRYLLDEIAKVKQAYLKARQEKIEDADFAHWRFAGLKKLESRLKRLVMEVRICNGKVFGITPEKIAKAREFPITELIEHKNYIANCPFHSDKTPSLNIRNNFYFCHGCGAKGDTIDFMIKKFNVDFKTAVNRLQ